MLVPSRVEPLGNTAVEAMFAQRPLVALRVQGLTGIVEDGRTRLLVPPGDPAALADAIARFLEDPVRGGGQGGPRGHPGGHPPGDQYAQAVPPSAAPAAAALRSTSYRQVNAARSSPAMAELPEPGWSEAFRRRPGGLLVLAPGGAAALQRPLDRTRMDADAETLPDRGGQLRRPQAGVGRQQFL